VKPFRSSQRNLIVSPRRKHSQKPEEFWELIVSPRRKHSQKPEEFWELIEALAENIPRSLRSSGN